jgi:hypothetical protein
MRRGEGRKTGCICNEYSTARHSIFISLSSTTPPPLPLSPFPLPALLPLLPLHLPSLHAGALSARHAAHVDKECAHVEAKALNEITTMHSRSCYVEGRVGGESKREGERREEKGREGEENEREGET